MYIDRAAHLIRSLSLEYDLELRRRRVTQLIDRGTYDRTLTCIMTPVYRNVR